MIEVETYTNRDGEEWMSVNLGKAEDHRPAKEWKQIAAQILRAVPSEKRKHTSRTNGKRGGRPRKSK